MAFSRKPILIHAENDVTFTLENPEVGYLGGRAFVAGGELKEDPMASYLSDSPAEPCGYQWMAACSRTRTTRA